MEDSFNRTEQRAFVIQQFQTYIGSNPLIPETIRKIWGLESAGHDFLSAMHPLLLALRGISNFLGTLPEISEKSAERSWKELHKASGGVLESEKFDEFRCIIEIEFMTNLRVAVSSEKIQERVKLTLAMILRMIQIELELECDEETRQLVETNEGG